MSSTAVHPNVLRAQEAVASLAARYPSPPRALAAPPPGSGLKPVLGAAGPPVVGHTFGFLADINGFVRRQHARFGEVSWTSGLGTKAVLVIGPEAIGEVLANREKAISSRLGWNYLIGPFFDRGVMLMDFEEHHHHRRIMQQAFKRERLVDYLAAMNPEIARGIDRWPVDGRFELFPAVKRLTLDLATRVFVGIEPGPEADRLNKSFVDAVHGGTAIIRADVPGGTWHRGLVGRRVLQDFFRRHIADKRADAEAGDLFGVLCRAESEDGERFSDEDVVNHMIFVLMAAHDTSTITLSMMAYYLGRHPEWQARLREESQALAKDAISFDDLDALPSMDLVMKETLRLNGPVGILARETIRDTAICGHHVPARTRLFVALSASMRMGPWWRDPDRFDPERFSSERREDKSHQYAWSPFGGSVHKCIGMHFGGMEVKAILHQLLLRCAWDVPAGYEPPMAFTTGPTPADGLPIRLRPLPR